MGRNKKDRLPMKTILQLQGILRHGDVTKLAKQSKLSKPVVSDILRGKRAITGHPALASCLREFINKRKQELLYENGYLEDLDSLYKEVQVAPMTQEDFDFKFLTEVKVMRMSKTDLKRLIEYKSLDIDKREINELLQEDLATRVWDELTSED